MQVLINIEVRKDEDGFYAVATYVPPVDDGPQPELVSRHFSVDAPGALDGAEAAITAATAQALGQLVGLLGERGLL